MKAVKIYNIKWNLEGVDPAERENILKELPEYKGFKVQDEFNVAERVPGVLKKKYGYDIETFSYTEIHIIEDIEGLLRRFAPRGDKPNKKLFKGRGKLSSAGEEYLINLENAIRRRLSLEEQGTPEDEMPKILDELMLGVESVTGLDWEGKTYDELIKPIHKMLRVRKPKNEFMGDEEEEEEDAEQYFGEDEEGDEEEPEEEEHEDDDDEEEGEGDGEND